MNIDFLFELNLFILTKILELFVDNHKQEIMQDYINVKAIFLTQKYQIFIFSKNKN